MRLRIRPSYSIRVSKPPSNDVTDLSHMLGVRNGEPIPFGPGRLLDGLAIRKIDPDEVVMRPSLLAELGLR